MSIFKRIQRILFVCSSSMLWPVAVHAADSPSPAPASPEQAPNASQPREVSYSWDRRNSNISRDVKLLYNQGDNRLTLSRLAFQDYSPVIGAEVKTGAEYAAGLSHSGWKQNPSAPFSWHVVVDVSGVGQAREKTIHAELENVDRLISVLPAADHVHLYALAADLEDWGQAVTPEEKSRLSELVKKRIKQKDYGDKESFRKSSLIYAGVRRVIADLGEGASLKAAVVLLSDGNDETGGGAAAAAGERDLAKSKLIEAAKNKHIPIHTLAFAQNSQDRGGFPNLLDLSLATEGLNFAASLHSFQFPEQVDVPRLLLLKSHPHIGELSIQLPQQEQSGDIRVTLQGKGGASGAIYIPGSLVDSLAARPAQPEPVPAPQEETAEESALAALLEQMESLNRQLASLAQMEAAAPPAPENLMALVEEIRNSLAPATAQANALKGKNRENLHRAVEKLQQASDVPERKRLWAKELETLCGESHPAAVTQEEILRLLGRSIPLPEPAPAPEPAAGQPEGGAAPASPFSPAVIGGSVAALLVILFMFFRVFRKKRGQPLPAEPAPWGTSSDSPAESPVPRPEPAGADDKGVDTQHPLLCELESLKDGVSWKIYKPTVIIGRSPTNDICIPNTSVSSSHCVLKLDRDGVWVLSDLGSANGIYYENSHHASITLRDGLEFELGEVALRFHDRRFSNL